MSNFINGDVFHDRYELIDYLGGGELAEVWRVKDKLSGIEVALKIYVRVGEAGIRQFIKDFTLTEALNHPFILKPSHVDVCDRRPYLILKYCPDGPVSNRIDDTSSIYRPFTERDIATFMFQMGGALDYLHSKQIIHRDIKPDNILIGDNGEFLLTDFGISRKVKNTIAKATSSTEAISFTRPYAPPEIMSSDDNPKKDIFSLGVTIYELLTQDLPFDGNGGTALTMGANVPDLPSSFSGKLNTFLKNCMNKEATLRPSASEIESFGKSYLQLNNWQLVDSSKPKQAKPSKNISNTQNKLPKSYLILAACVLLLSLFTIWAYQYFTRDSPTVSSLPIQKTPIDSSEKIKSDPIIEKVKAEQPIIEEKKIEKASLKQTPKVEPQESLKKPNSFKPAVPQSPLSNLNNQTGILLITSDRDARIFIDEKFMGTLQAFSSKSITLKAIDAANNYKVYLIKLQANGEEVTTSVAIVAGKTTHKKLLFE